MEGQIETEGRQGQRERYERAERVTGVNEGQSREDWNRRKARTEGREERQR